MKHAIITLVLAMASVVNASLQISVNGDTDPTDSEYVIVPSQEIILSIWTDADITSGGPYEGYLALVVDTSLAKIDYTTGVPVIPDSGILLEHSMSAVEVGFSLPASEDGIFGSIWLFETSQIRARSTIFDQVIFHCEAFGDAVIKLYRSEDGSSLDLTDIVVIHQLAPEPEPPVANAGPNQVAYVWNNRKANVTLDGSASYDENGDVLSYLWRWSIDGNDYEANRVSPTIELPAGVHTIELVVNDGFEDSEPNYVVITIIEPTAGTWIVIDKPGTTETQITGISGDNIIGIYNDGFYYQGFIFNGSTWTTLEAYMLGAVISTMPYGVSDGNIVGTWIESLGMSNGERMRGFLYDGTNWISLDMPGATETWVSGISGNNIVGYYWDSSHDTHDFLYDGVNWTTIDEPSGWYTWLTGIYGSNIVGGYSSNSGKVQGFIYDGVNWTILNTPWSDFDVCPTGIFENKIVGTYSNVHGNYVEEHGFLYDGANWITIDAPGAVQTYPIGISGNNIFGCYWGSSNITHGFVYTIPETTPPIADAGPSQVAYAWIDGIAEVTLDGSGSYDADGDELTYLWRWSIDGNDYEANEVNPIIELPVGEHTIELVVNDGWEDSEPNEVVITVVEPIEGSLWVTPRIINGRCEQRRIMAMLRLPEGITKDQIDSNSTLLLYPGEIEASWQHILQYGRRSVAIFACFDASALMDAVGSSGPVQLNVVGRLKTGQYFYGSDSVRIINPPRRPTGSRLD